MTAIEERGMTDVGSVQSNLLPGLIQRTPELGRIRMGDKSEKGYPIRLKTFRLTSYSKSRLDAAAALYGGKVEAWTDAPDEGMWELITESAELDIFVPASLSVISQSMELWAGGTLERRCDGTTEQLSDSGCICAAKGLEGAERECDIVTRLNVMLPRLPGLGVWRLDTGGWMAATTLPSTVTLLARLTPGAWIPAVLRAEQRSKKSRDADGKVETHRFVVPVLDLPNTTLEQVVGGSKADTPLLEEGESSKPPTAAEKAATKRAQLEAQRGTAAPEPSLPRPRGACPIDSPKGDSCRLALGHDGDHKAGRVSWPTPPKNAAAAAPSAAPERPPVSDDEAGPEEAAGVVTAPAADLTDEPKEDEPVEGEFAEPAASPSGQIVACDEKSPYDEDDFCVRERTHSGNHRGNKATW